MKLVSPALAEANGNLHSGSREILFQVLKHEVPCPHCLDTPDLGESATLVDGQALVFATGMPQHAANFGDLADTFIRSLLQAGRAFKHDDVVFDRYYESSIENGTRNKQGKDSQPIRMIEKSGNPPACLSNGKPPCPILTTKLTLPDSCPSNS